MDEQANTAKRHGVGSSLSLRNKLLIFAACLVLVPGVILTLIAEQSGRNSLEQVIGRQLAREAGHTAEQLSFVLRRERETLANFARQDLMREVRVADIDKRVSSALATLRDGSPARLDYLVVDAEGWVVASSDPGLIGRAPTWAGTGAPGEAELRGPLSVAGRAGACVVMTTPIRDPDHGRRLLGTLVGLFDWGELTGVTRSVRDDLAAQGIDAEVLVSRADGAVLGGARRADAKAALSGVAVAGLGARPDYAIDKEAGLIIGRAALAPGLPAWRLAVVESRAHALAPAHRLSRRLLLTMGLALVAALALAALAARRVVQPLSELTVAIRDLSPVDAGRASVPVRSDDEVGVLAEAFNEMASELDRAQRELVEAEKFAFVGELAAGVAHEIRTALGVLGSATQMLERSLPTEARAGVAELAQMIREEVSRLGGVVNELLTLDRARPLQLEAVPVSEPLARAVEFVGAQAREKGVEILLRGAPDEPLLLCECELVYQVAVNLLVNATQALSSGGHVEVRVLEERDGYGGFEVRDDGPGIPGELRERIFEPFVTARDGGVGLGLTFVKRVVHDHRGLVSLESGPGEGTCIRVRIPVAEGAL
jgi:two-component system sensor histidine kinase HydH